MALFKKDVDEVRHAFLDAEASISAAEVRADPARRHQHQRAPILLAARGIAAHEGVERRLAAAINFAHAGGVVRDAALA